MIITAKPLDEMTLAELKRERNYWDEIIEQGLCSGSVLKSATDCRDGCDAMIARRELEAAAERAG